MNKVKNKTIANWLIGVLVLAILGGVIQAPDGYYTVIGFGFLAFGILAIIRLYHLADPVKLG